MNEDYVQPGQGFGTHPHKDMEIVTYVLRALWNTRIRWAMARCCGPASFNGCPRGPASRIANSILPAASRCICTKFGCFPIGTESSPVTSRERFAEDGARIGCDLLLRIIGTDGSLLIHRTPTFIYRRSSIVAASSIRLPLAGRRGCKCSRTSVTEWSGAGASDGVAVSDSKHLLTVEADGKAEIMLFDLA